MNRIELLQTAKPILFNTEMVRAILDGRKTCTRRLVKFHNNRNPNWSGYVKEGLILYNGNNQPCNKPSPYKSGDILYVRETWRNPNNVYCYRADTAVLEKSYTWEKQHGWRPSIHMPKEAARLFLRVTDVRVERVQDIITGDYRTPGNINKEGLYKPCIDCTHHNGNCKDFIREQTCRLVHSFAALWNSTIRKSGIETYCWAANPWVWVIEFERVEVQE